MQPVQNITVNDRVSRTQYQYTLEDPDMDELNTWTDKFVAKLKKLPDLEDVATDQQTGALAVSLDIDRVTASRLGIAPSTIDNTLYDAFGQRQVNTLYTQLNQYHVILETGAAVPARIPAGCKKMYIQANTSSGASGPGARPRSRHRLRLRRARTRSPLGVKYTPSRRIADDAAGTSARRRAQRDTSTTANDEQCEFAPMPYR